MIIEFIFIRPRGREYRSSCLSRKNEGKQARKNLLFWIEFCGKSLFFPAFCDYKGLQGFNKKSAFLQNSLCKMPIMADRVGFEPTVPLLVHLISSQGRYDRFDTCPYSLAVPLYPIRSEKSSRRNTFFRRRGGLPRHYFQTVHINRALIYINLLTKL